MGHHIDSYYVEINDRYRVQIDGYTRQPQQVEMLWNRSCGPEWNLSDPAYNITCAIMDAFIAGAAWARRVACTCSGVDA